MNDCEDFPTTITLAGGYTVRMTRAENNAWSEFCLQCEEFRAFNRAEARLNQAVRDQQGNGATGNEADKCLDRKLAMFYAARDWAIENVAREALEGGRTAEEIAADTKEAIDAAKALTDIGGEA